MTPSNLPRSIIALSGVMALYLPGSGLAQSETGNPPSVERAQFIAQMDAEFSRLDGDGDGQVTPAEIIAVQRGAAQAEALRQNRAVFDRLDQDGNGQLAPEEFAQLANPQAIPTDAAPLMSRFDTNGDGLIALVEYRIATQDNFDRIDTDRDGTITPLEMRAAGIVE